MQTAKPSLRKASWKILRDENWRDAMTTTNVASANVGAAAGARQKVRVLGAIATIIVAIWATATPASASSLASRARTNRTASTIHRVQVASLGPASCWYVLPLILGTG